MDAGLSNATQAGTNATCCGQGYNLTDLVNLGPDLMGIALLKGGGDPDEAAVRGALPGFVGGKGQVAAFVGSRKGPAYALSRDGAPVRKTGLSQFVVSGRGRRGAGGVRMVAIDVLKCCPPFAHCERTVSNV